MKTAIILALSLVSLGAYAQSAKTSLEVTVRYYDDSEKLVSKRVTITTANIDALYQQYGDNTSLVGTISNLGQGDERGNACFRGDAHEVILKILARDEVIDGGDESCSKGLVTEDGNTIAYGCTSFDEPTKTFPVLVPRCSN